jgi:hypothetical protein
MPWIFTYSDLSPQVIEGLFERAPFCSLPASLPNFKVSFKGRSRKWGGALATLDKARKSWVYGSALLLPPDEIRILDKYYSAYEGKDVTIFLDATKDKVKAKTYLLKTTLPYGQPSEEYIKAILKHLKFFWGQTGSGKMTLTNFNINIETDTPSEKKTRKKSAKDTKPAEAVEEAVEENLDSKTEKKPRRRRAVKKK